MWFVLSVLVFLPYKKKKMANLTIILGNCRRSQLKILKQTHWFNILISRPNKYSF